MKRILISAVLIVALVLPSVAQEKEQKLKELEKLEEQTEKVTPPDTLTAVEEEVEVITEEEWDDTSRVKIGEIVTVEETDDETVIRIGKKAVKIFEDEDDIDVNIFEEEFEESDDPADRRKSFDGHLGGIEIGYNNFTSGRWLKNETPLEGWLDLNTAKSTSFNIVSPPVSLGFTRHFGLVTALGVNFNNYRFDGNNTIVVDGEGIVTPSYPEDPIRFDKSKLATVYGILPVMLEVQIPVSHGSTINLGAGVTGAVKLGSHTKVVYHNDGKQKDKNRDDFNLNALRYGVTARAGYEMVQVYGTCWLSPMFEKGKGPVLYPFEIGLALTIND
ncbi:MAG: outer membrane beta-barrel protein [Bacteroidales bacterium]|jgi:opacity protein-like surface antigen|nr:outer membrane beta-barrel protein [Bacteroidales bacterium]